MGVELHWTLNQEVAFSLTDQPGVSWLPGGYLWSLKSPKTKERLILCPASNTDYNNVAAFVEGFWGYLQNTIAYLGGTDFLTM